MFPSKKSGMLSKSTFTNKAVLEPRVQADFAITCFFLPILLMSHLALPPSKFNANTSKYVHKVTKTPLA